MLPPRCLHLYEKTLSSEGNQFFSDRSLGVLIFFFFSPLKQLSWETAVLEIHKEAVFFLTFLTAIFATRLADNANQNNTKKCLPAEPPIICLAPDPVLRRCHTITQNERLCSRFEPRDSQCFIVPPPPPRPQSSTSQTPQHLPPVGLRKPLLSLTSQVVLSCVFSVLCVVNGLVCKKQNKNKKQQQQQIPELLTATYMLQNC